MVSSVILALYVLATSAGLLLIRVGTTGGTLIKLSAGRVTLHFGIAALLGILLYLISFVLYVVLISRFSLGFIVPLTTGLVYVVVFASSFVFLHERFGVYQIGGIAAILVGLALLQIK
ncbi:MAG: hypothetical protein M0Z34_11960 [Nitrospiraceae bacterium]|nr:hypothetical protein [Nitrospiraceae bacterium]